MDTGATAISRLQLGRLFIPRVSKRTFHSLEKAFLAGHDVTHFSSQQFRRQKQGGQCEFESRLVDRVSSRSSWAIQ